MTGLLGNEWLSPTFIERIGWVIFHSVWQFSLVAFIACFPLRVVSQNNPGKRYTILTALLLSAVACPIATYAVLGAVPRADSSTDLATLVDEISSMPHGTDDVLEPLVNGRESLESTNTPRLDSTSSGIIAEDSPNKNSVRTTWTLQIERLLQPWLEWIVRCWLLGVMICTLRPLAGWLNLRRLTRTGVSRASAEVQAAIERISNQLGLHRGVRVLESALAEVPLVVGYFRPVILLPISFATTVPPVQLDAILAHELAHIRRHDFVINVIQVMVETLFFYHPAIWWLSQRIRAEREHCCDDLAIAMTRNRAEYGRALLAIEAMRGKSATFSLAASDGSLLSRVRRITGQSREQTRFSGWFLLTVAVCLTGIAITLGVSRSNEAIAMGNDNQIDIDTPSSEHNESDDLSIPSSRQPNERMRSSDPIASSASNEHPASAVDIQYPYCVVPVDNLKARPLSTAVETFNLESRKNPIGIRQEPITIAETLGAISKSIGQPHVANATKQTLREIVASQELPPNAYFRRFTRFDDEEKMNGVWWVRLVVEGQQPPIYSVPIRSAHIFTRPYTQMERQQLAQRGVMLINRFSSFFEDVPNILLLAEFPNDSVSALTHQVETAISTNDFGKFAQTFEWTAVSESTRSFVKSEFDMLAASTIHSISVTPRNFRGKMLHWSAYQYFEPNLPVVGYLDIEYSTSPRARRKTLSLEMASAGNKLRLVNYTSKGLRELPKQIPQGLTTRGHIEPVSDGTFLQTTLTANPGSLITAHLANEEIWQRDLQNKYDSAIKSIARKIVINSQGESWQLHDCDDEPSVLVNGMRGFRIVLRRTWREYTDTPQQEASIALDRDASFINRDAYWEFVLFRQTSENVSPDTRSVIRWSDNKSPYHTRGVYLGEGLGYSWFSKSTLFGQEAIRTRLELRGGDDRIQLLVDGLTVEDSGTATSNSCQHLVARFGDVSLPYLRDAIDKAQIKGEAWRMIGSLAHIRTPQATEMLLQYYRSGNQDLHQAAVYALVHQPYRADAKSAYLDMLVHQNRTDRLASACEAVLEHHWNEALPILRERTDRPRSLRELVLTVATKRTLEGNPIAPELRQAEQTLRRVANGHNNPVKADAISHAREVLVNSDDEAANLVALSLMQFTTKGNSEAVRRIGLEILKRRPRASTISFLKTLRLRLPKNHRGLIQNAIDSVASSNVGSAA